MIEQTHKLNMIPFAEQDLRDYEPPVVTVSQYDKGLRTLQFKLYDGEDPFEIPENTAAYIFGMKPDGNAFQYPMTITEESLLTVDVQNQMAIVPGLVTCEIILFEGDESGDRIGIFSSAGKPCSRTKAGCAGNPSGKRCRNFSKPYRTTPYPYLGDRRDPS